MNKNFLIEIVAFNVMLGIAVCMWWNLYYAPKEAMMNEIMECMDEINDWSRMGYDNCYATLTEKQG